MNRYSLYTLSAMLSIASACALAQETPAEQDQTAQDQTAPEAASSPHQREATTTEAAEAPANQDTEPSSSSSPHQRHATKEGEKGMGEKNVAQQDRMMKDCINMQQEKDSAMTKDEAKQACADQMKAKQKTRG